MRNHLTLPIKQLKVYQSVTFEGAQNSFFTPSKYMSLVRASRNPLELTRIEGGGVLVRSDKCLIEIGYANIAFIEYDLDAVIDETPVKKLATK